MLLLLSSIAVIGIIGATLWHVFKIRYTAYSFRVKQDYVYDFSRTDGVRQPCTLSQGSVSLPVTAEKYDTAFLQVRVKTTFMGYFRQPRIDVCAGNVISSEDVEYGVRGIRYLNISRFVDAGVKNILLKGYHVTADDGPAELIMFRNPDIKKARVLVIAPHPDDAEIAAYGLYSDAAETHIATVTAGEANDVPGDIPADQKEGYLQKGKVRVWDSIAIPYLAGVPFDHCVMMGYFDNTLESMFKDKRQRVKSRSTGLMELDFFRSRNVSRLLADVPAVPDWNSLVNDFQVLVTKIKPDIVLALYPAIDYNTDHKYSTVALFEAIQRAHIQGGTLYLYTNHFTITDYYPFGSEGYPITLPPNFGQPLYFRGLYAHFLDSGKMRDKLYALDAMHDLRPGPDWRTVKGAFDLLMFIGKGQIYGRDYSYYRRAVRSNELFFVVPVSEIYNPDIRRRILGMDG